MRPLLWVLGQNTVKENVGDAFCHLPERLWGRMGVSDGHIRKAGDRKHPQKDLGDDVGVHFSVNTLFHGRLEKGLGNAGHLIDHFCLDFFLQFWVGLGLNETNLQQIFVFVHIQHPVAHHLGDRLVAAHLTHFR